MPYIPESERAHIDYAIEELARSLIREKQAADNDGLGALNYALTHLLLGLIDNLRYSTIVSVIGTLEAVKLEFYRRAAAPYEDAKRVENGDVYV